VSSHDSQPAGSALLPAFVQILRRSGLAVFVLGASLTVSTGQDRELRTVSIAEYGAVPDDGKNDAAALRQALDELRSQSGIRLVFPPGRYDFRDEKAVSLMEEVLSGKFGNNPEKAIFRPYFSYVRGLDFSGFRDLVVDAFGAELICDGWMEPVSIDRASSVTIRGLTIDYLRAPYSIGKVIDVGDNHLDVEFGDRYPLRPGIPVPRIGFWDPNRQRLVGDFSYPASTELIAPNRLRIQAKVAREMLGLPALCPHSFHFRPAILIQDSENVTLEHVTIHSQPGMGIVGHHSRDLTFLNLRVIPRAGSLMSTNTDATHFTSCSGLLRFDACQFEGQGDDSANIHNYYYTLKRGADAESYEIRVDAPTGTHAQALDCPDLGDRLELVERKTLLPVSHYRVLRVDRFPEAWKAVIQVDRPLPEPLEDYLFINVSRLPRVEIRGCQVRSHRARAFLIKTRQVLIENSTIENTTGTAIHIGAEGYWHEGPGSADVTVRYNRIFDCGYGDGTQDHASGIAVNVDAPKTDVPGIHQRILIQGNQIVAPASEHGIFISGASDVDLLYNEILSKGESIRIENSERVRVDKVAQASSL